MAACLLRLPAVRGHAKRQEVKYRTLVNDQATSSGSYANAGVGSQETEVNSSSDMYRLIRLEAHATKHPYDLNENVTAEATRCEGRMFCFIFILLSFHSLYRDPESETSFETEPFV